MISARTGLAAVIGDPVEHSLSPAIHTAAFDALGIDCVFLALRVGAAELASAVGGLRAIRVRGLSVTMPHKAAVAALLDRLSSSAQAIGAVNCVTRENSALVGHNTDGDGLVDALREAGCDPRGSRCLVLGAGGAARSAVFALGAAGAEIVAVRSRRPEAAAAAATLAGSAGRGADEVTGSYEVVVNATPVGMNASDGLPLPEQEITAGQTVVDLVYAAGTTRLLEVASAAQAVAIEGTSVLMHQAARAFELWTGHPAPLGVMAAAVRAAQDGSKLDR